MKTVCLKFICGLLCVIIIGCSALPIKKRHPGNPALGSKIVDIAVRYLGTPYRYGGTTPGGFDCSGFTSYVLKKAGILIPRTANAQYRFGDRVAGSDLRKGDLVFFTRWGFIGKLFPPSHVGIYVGNKKFIHAPSNGGRVRYDSLGNVYWKKHFKGGRDLSAKS